MRKYKKAAALLSVLMIMSISAVPVSADWGKTSSGKYYYTDSSGKKVTGWKTIGGNKYYFNSDGTMRTGWLKLDDDYYYLNSDGKAVVNKTVKIDGKQYTFDKSGKLVTKKFADGWHKDNSGKYFYTVNDVRYIGQKNIDGATYFFNSDGTMYTGWKTAGSDYYYYKSDGKMAKNTALVIDGTTYNFDKNGKYYAVTKASANSSSYYVLNTNTKKFHRPDCSEVKKIKDKNKDYSDDSRAEIISQGYSPCKKCDP